MADILKFFGTNLKISGPLHTIPLEWFTPPKKTYSDKLIRPFQTPKANRAVKLKSLISVTTLTLLFFQFIQISLNKSAIIEISLLSWMLFFIFTVSNFHINICRIKSPEIAAFINGLIQFDQMYPKKKLQFSKLTFQEFACVVTVYGLYVSSLIFPFGAVFGFHWIDPNKPSLAGYWLIPKPHDFTDNILTKVTVFGIKTVVIMFNYWAWSFVLTGPGFVVALLQNVCVNTILGSIET